MPRAAWAELRTVCWLLELRVIGTEFLESGHLSLVERLHLIAPGAVRDAQVAQRMPQLDQQFQSLVGCVVPVEMELHERVYHTSLNAVQFVDERHMPPFSILLDRDQLLSTNTLRRQRMRRRCR
jgi:hypothetical protein